MAVYVDEIKDYTAVAELRGLRYTHWCHLLADTEHELHVMARRLCLQRRWYQPHAYWWHYDITPGKRIQAIRHGAIQVDYRFVAALMAKRREALKRDGLFPVSAPEPRPEDFALCRGGPR